MDMQQVQVPMVQIGDTLTRVIVTLQKGENAKVNVTSHKVTRQFSEEGVCIDNTYFKVYKGMINQIKSHFVQGGFGAEMFIVGSDENEIRSVESQLVEVVREEVDAAYKEIMDFKSRVANNERSYVSEVDRTPWGEDKGSKIAADSKTNGEVSA